MRASVRRIGLASLARHGCLAGAVAALVPSLLVGILLLALVGVARNWVEGWQSLPIEVLGREIARIDVVTMLRLDGLLDWLAALAGMGIGALVLWVLACALACGILGSAVAVSVGLAYNLLASLTGGIEVELAHPSSATRSARRGRRPARSRQSADSPQP